MLSPQAAQATETDAPTGKEHSKPDAEVARPEAAVGDGSGELLQDKPEDLLAPLSGKEAAAGARVQAGSNLAVGCVTIPNPQGGNPMVLEPASGSKSLWQKICSPKGFLVSVAVGLAAGLGGWKLWNSKLVNNIINSSLEVFKQFDLATLRERLDTVLANRTAPGFRESFDALEAETREHVDKLLGMYREVLQGERAEAADRFKAAVLELFKSAEPVTDDLFQEAKDATEGFAHKVVRYRYRDFEPGNAEA